MKHKLPCDFESTQCQMENRKYPDLFGWALWVSLTLIASLFCVAMLLYGVMMVWGAVHG